MRVVKKIILHCSKSSPLSNYGVEEIKKDHLLRGMKDIAYHFVIDASGKIHKGRDLDVVGAHCKGQNHDSIGICIIGGHHWEFDFLPKQILSARLLISVMVRMYSLEYNSVYGHNEFDKSTRCPVINMETFRSILNACY